MRLRRTREYANCYIGNMDETPVWLEMPGASTLEQTGEKTIAVASTGHHKKRITVMLAAMADGTKLTPMVLLPGKRPLPKADIPAGVITYMCGTGKSWANEEIVMYWLSRIWGRNNTSRRMLVWDSFRGHITPLVKEVCASVTTVTWRSFRVVVRRCFSRLMFPGTSLSRIGSKSSMMSGCSVVKSASPLQATDALHP